MPARLTLQFGSCLLAATAIVAGIGCSGGGDSSAPTASIGSETSRTDDAAGDNSQRVSRPVVLTSDTNSSTAAKSPAQWKPRVVIKTSLGPITVELDAENAPVTVDNFLNGYVDRGFYTDTIFHHVDSSMLVATGGYTSDLQPKSVRAPIRCEADNGQSNRRGTLAMARLPEYPDSATSQFFINIADNTFLDHQGDDDSESFGYCVFGRVIDGMDVVDKIAASPVTEQGDFPSVPETTVVVEAIERIE